jgi:DNA-binding HxlR family transcriptional regulator
MQEEVSPVMSGELEHPLEVATRRLERAIVMQLLRDDRAERWRVAALAIEIPDFAPAMLARALARLERAGVVCRIGESVCASRAARHLDRLDLIGI